MASREAEAIRQQQQDREQREAIRAHVESLADLHRKVDAITAHLGLTDATPQPDAAAEDLSPARGIESVPPPDGQPATPSASPPSPPADPDADARKAADEGVRVGVEDEARAKSESLRKPPRK